MSGAAFVLHTERLLLRGPSVALTSAVGDYQRRNQDHFARWDPPYPADHDVPAAIAERLELAEQAFAAGSAFRYWFSLRKAPTRLIGQAHLTQVTRSAFQNAMLGYSLDHAAQGQGLMQEALRAVITEMFGPAVRLHRLQAAVRPENERSRAVLRAMGFEKEGLSRRYLFINGEWRDHEVYALLNPDWAPDLAP